MSAACALRMATGGDAGHRTVRVAWPPFMVRVRTGLVVMRLGVTIDAGYVRVIRLIDMAIGANGPVVGQLPEIVVIEGRAQPAGGVMAARSGAVCGEARSDVVGHATAQGGGTLPGGYVAAIAVRRQTARVVAANVASRARSFGGVGVGAG